MFNPLLGFIIFSDDFKECIINFIQTESAFKNLIKFEQILNFSADELYKQVRAKLALNQIFLTSLIVGSFLAPNSVMHRKSHFLGPTWLLL